MFRNEYSLIIRLKNYANVKYGKTMGLQLDALIMSFVSCAVLICYVPSLEYMIKISIQNFSSSSSNNDPSSKFDNS